MAPSSPFSKLNYNTETVARRSIPELREVDLDTAGRR
jgi:hypothetical protein